LPEGPTSRCSVIRGGEILDQRPNRVVPSRWPVTTLLAVPLAATIQIVVREVLRYRNHEARLGGET
jgi:hypothetical protein